MELPKRKLIRLKGYDYSRSGYYFITICTYNRMHLLSHIVGAGSPRPGERVCIKLTPYGEITEEFVRQLSDKYCGVKIDKYVIMPNHIHLILIINYCFLNNSESGRENPATDGRENFTDGREDPPTKKLVTVGEMMGWFKYQTTKAINDSTGGGASRVWQRSYHDRIIRDEQEYREIWGYIDSNPMLWKQDRYYSNK